MNDLYEKAMKSVHIPFIQEATVLLSNAGYTQETDDLVERIWWLTEGYKEHQSPQERIRKVMKEQNEQPTQQK